MAITKSARKKLLAKKNKSFAMKSMRLRKLQETENDKEESYEEKTEDYPL